MNVSVPLCDPFNYSQSHYYYYHYYYYYLPLQLCWDYSASPRPNFEPLAQRTWTRFNSPPRHADPRFAACLIPQQCRHFHTPPPHTLLNHPNYRSCSTVPCSTRLPFFCYLFDLGISDESFGSSPCHIFDFHYSGRRYSRSYTDNIISWVVKPVLTSCIWFLYLNNIQALTILFKFDLKDDV